MNPSLCWKKIVISYGGVTREATIVDTVSYTMNLDQRELIFK